MRVKRYLVDTLPEAVQLIRNELGNNAIILESKEVKNGGFLGMFGKKKLEVLAAVEPNNNKVPDKKKLDKSEVELVVEQILKASQKNKEQSNSDNFLAELKRQQTTQGDKLDVPIHSSSHSSTESVPNLLSHTYNSYKGHTTFTNGDKVQTKPIENVVLKEKPTLVAEKLDENEEKLFSSDSQISKTEQFILKELKHLRLEMKAISEQKGERVGESVNISLLRTHLFDQELTTEWINTLCELLEEIEVKEGRLLGIEEVWEIARKQLLEWLLPFSKATIEHTTRVIQLVGPTGVGKTTTIAKLAANFTIQQNKKVGFITADTYRIAAVEQLRTYANILNLPLEVVFSPLDLTRAYKELEGCEVILMDTAGRNFKSDLFVSEVNSLIANTQLSEGVLVVSLTSRTRDMALVAEKFGKFGVRKVVFTKMDEANAYGSIFNMIMQFGLQPLFVTSGQNVPDDIEPFTTENYVNLLLGDAKHE